MGNSWDVLGENIVYISDFICSYPYLINTISLFSKYTEKDNGWFEVKKIVPVNGNSSCQIFCSNIIKYVIDGKEFCLFVEEDGNIIIRSNVPKNEIEKTYKKEIIKDIHRCIS